MGAVRRKDSGTGYVLLRVCLLAVLLAESSATAWAAEATQTAGAIPSRMEIVVSHSEVISSPAPIKRTAVADPAIADVTVLSPTQVLVSAKKPGATQIVLWDSQDRPRTVTIIVTGDKSLLEAQIERLYPESSVRVNVAQSTLILTGSAKDPAEARAIVQLAESFGARVVNQITVPGTRQVLLQVRVSEVSRSELKRMGINAVYSDPNFFIQHTTNDVGVVNVGSPAGVIGRRPTWSNLTASAAGANSNLSFGVTDAKLQVFLDALKENGIMTLLAEPNLVALSGQKATFLVGGEFPVPVPQDEDTITIMFREYGIRLNFVPTVLSGGNIRLEVEPEVSDLDYTNAVEISGFVVPGLITRRVQTAVELKSGQTFAIAGLISKSLLSTKSAVPVLGEVPILGGAFRSTVHREEEAELLVLVTPQLVDPLQASQVPGLPTDYVRAPTDVELFLFGLQERPADMGTAAPATPARGAVPVLLGPTGQQVSD